MTEDGNDVPEVPTYDPATVAWNLWAQTVSAEALKARMASFSLGRLSSDPEETALRQAAVACEAFLAGYRAGVADTEARRNEAPDPDWERE